MSESGQVRVRIKRPADHTPEAEATPGGAIAAAVAGDSPAVAAPAPAVPFFSGPADGVYLINWETFAALGASLLELHVSAMICLAGKCTPTGRIKLSAADVANAAVVVAQWLLGLAAPLGISVAAQAPAGLTAAAATMTTMAATYPPH